MKKYRILLACSLAVLSPTLCAMTNQTTIPTTFKSTIDAPDTTTKGPHAVASAEYRFPATTDDDILSDRKTEIWAKLFYPNDIAASDKAPLIVMLHGNHATCGYGSNPRHDTSCEYTQSGTCPTGYVPVPNHEGYDYLAENLTSWGYVVVSINANRGITCGGGVKGDYGLNLARGKLVLKHLSLLYKWSTEGNAPASLGLGTDGLIGKIDFASVGLLGHSRGGEGVRAAYNLYLDQDSTWPAKIPGLSVKAIYEIGAVDGQTSRVLNANGTVWNQLLPMCDGDVSDLQGRYPFERMLLTPTEPANAQKSLYEVWGANHNFFNTEWQSSDSYGCFAGDPIFDRYGSSSDKQQKIALASVTSFFRSRLGTESNPTFNQHFNPLDTLPNAVSSITQIDRDFTASPAAVENQVIDDFDKDTGINSSGNPNISHQITIQHRALGRDGRVASITWEAPGQSTFFEAVWSGQGQGRDIHDSATLDFRIARDASLLNKEATTDFGIQLEEASGRFSNEIRVSDYVLLNGPGTDNIVLKTVRIPLSAFQGIDLTKVHGVRFVFDNTKSGSIYLANIRAHRNKGLGEENLSLSARKPAFTAVSSAANKMTSLSVEQVPASKNSLRVVQSRTLAGESVIEIRLASDVPFPAMNRLPVLHIGNKEFKLSHYSDPVQLKELTFTLTMDEYQSVSKSSEVTVTNGKIWKFGTLAKSIKK